MKFKGTIFFSMVSYAIGWLLFFLTKDDALLYIMGLFLYINVFTVFHPVIFRYGLMRPLQLSLSSVGILSLIDGNISLVCFVMFAVLSLVFIEKEDIYASVPKNFLIMIQRFLAAIIMPFSVTYLIMVIRPFDDIAYMLTVFLYFSMLYIFSKWFTTIVSFGCFTLSQMALFVYIIEVHMNWTSLQITTFFISIFVFLIIGYGRKGLLTYTSNNNR